MRVRSSHRHHEHGGGEPMFLWMAVGAISLLAAGLSVAGLVLPSRSDTSSAAGTGSSGAATASAPRARTEQVTLGDIFLKPTSIAVDAGTDLTLAIRNSGALDHDLKINGSAGTSMLKPGTVATLHVGVVNENVTLWCSVAGHKDAGMKLDVVVKAAGAAPAASAAAAPAAMPAMAAMAASQTPAAATPTTAAEPQDAAIDFSATPTADWMPYDPALKPAEGGVEHKVTFHATEKVMEVAPGVTQEMWTFNNTVPGPVLRGKVGDLFTVTLVNDGKVEHSIDFHASKVAWNDKMRSIKPGESLIYQYKAKFAGIFMYHCGTAPALHHIGNGMYGAVIIDPPVLAPVDHEYVLVQSELYTGPMGKPGSLAKMTAEKFDAVVFNGYVSQYKFHPIRVEPNERVRLWVLDAGPSENSAFHIVGTIFDTVFKEGTYVLQPDARQGGSQVLDLQPAQGGFVEFSFDEAGLYPIVTHKFANVGKGALGLFQAGDVKGASTAGH